MAGLIVRRFFYTIPVLLIISIVTFGLMHYAPGGPWDRDTDAGKQIDAKTQTLLNQQFGLDKPLWRQYTGYIFGDFNGDNGSFRCGAICGNLGPSYRQRGRMVQDILFKPFDEDKGFIDSKFGYSLRLGLLALIMAIVVGIPAGVISALKHNSWIDLAITFVTNVGISVPSFVAGFFAILVLAVGLGIIPVRQQSWDGLSPWLLPAAVFSFGTMASFARLTRASILEVMKQDYVRTARAKGAWESSVIWRHMLRNALIPVITTLGPAMAALITGSIVMEQVFGIPGVGTDFIRSIGNRDYSMIMGTTLFYALLIVIANLSVDILYGVADPRIRVE